MAGAAGSDRERTRNELARELLRWMAEDTRPAPSEDARFTDLALRIFAYQYEANVPYRRYCDRRGVRPVDVRDWRDIPAVATDAFKQAPLTCFPAERAAAVFVTSGTTMGVVRGRHYLRTFDLYHASLLPAFAAALVPDGARLPAVVLGFSPDAMPESSLSDMFGVVVERFAAPAEGAAPGARGDGVTYFVGPGGIDLDGASARLAALESAGRPVLLMGTAFAFVHLLDHLAVRERRLRLPPGSRLMDTGGYKGRSREAPKDELYALYTERLGIPAGYIVNEYGMTEMSSQCYDDILRDEMVSGAGTGGRGTAARRPRPALLAGSALNRRKAGPPWVRTLVVDPETLTPVPHGRGGILRHYDLANLDSVIGLQTADLGVADESGFEVAGRATGAEMRGCSLAVEELLRAQS